MKNLTEEIKSKLAIKRNSSYIFKCKETKYNFSDNGMLDGPEEGEQPPTYLFAKNSAA